ncbi:hypothetical protein BD626DRAFT_516111 [Schizophyllum amplum]|uniref:DUF6593 domain-containing protein n=1 Tax=Schizophyllum amplum TaxID=97359 RepID=A0A550BX80_9AGAR|nr:hypothetical protein BD626DRAFT_516111 [Auriculariopsis ampla]
MDFTLSSSDILHTTFIDPTNAPRYRTSTTYPSFAYHQLKLYRTYPDGEQSGADDGAEKTIGNTGEQLIGMLTMAGGRGPNGRYHQVVVHSRDVTPERVKKLSTAEIFVATDGRSYKWKGEGIKHIGNFLLVDEETKQTVAHFVIRNPFSSKPCKLHVNTEVLPILDELVATLLYMILRSNIGY